MYKHAHLPQTVLHSHILINMHSDAFQCHLHVRQDTLHGTSQRQAEVYNTRQTQNRQSQQKQATTKGSLIWADLKTNYINTVE